MQKNDYQTWLIKWFSEKTGITQDAVDRNFFSEGWLDSFKTLELILEIEKTFKIVLNDAIFNDSRFYTIAGLAEILSELQAT